MSQRGAMWWTGFALSAIVVLFLFMDAGAKLAAIRPVLGSIPVVPEMNTWEPALTPWLNSGELGACDVVMI